MKTERDLDDVLAEIGREHRAIGAPDRLEPLLRAAASRGIHAIGRSGTRRAWTLAAAALLLAVIATAGAVWLVRGNHRSQGQQAVTAPIPHQPGPEPVPSTTRVPGRQSGRSGSAPARNAGKVHRSLRDFLPKQATWNSLDEFVALPVSEGLPTASELSVVRVKLRGSDLQQYGLETPADAVAQSMLAEFVVGEDGLPRAIRIVR